MSTIPPVTVPPVTAPAVQKTPAELDQDRKNLIATAKAQFSEKPSDAYWNANIAWDADTYAISKMGYLFRWFIAYGPLSFGKDFKEECHDLAVALTTQNPSVEGFGLNAQQKLDAEQAAAKAAEKVFYTAFKNRCAMVNVGNDCEKISIYFNAAMDTFKEVVDAAELPFKRTIAQAKLADVRTACWSMMAGDMVQTFASQSAASITPESLLKQTQDMANVFGTSKTSRANIFSDLVKAVVTKHPKAFNNRNQENNGDLGAAGLALKYASHEEREALYTKLEKEFQTTLDARKARLTVLAGHYDSAKNVPVKGTVTVAREAFDQAITERKAAESVLNTQKNKAGKSTFDAVALTTANTAFLSAQAKEKAANEEYTKLFEEQAILIDINRHGKSPWNHLGNYREGSIKEMEEKHATVNYRTHAKANHLATFYDRLSQVDVANLSDAYLADLYTLCEIKTN